MLILIHSSKTMTARLGPVAPSQPRLLADARELMDHLQGLSVSNIGRIMGISPALAAKVQAMHAGWSDDGQGMAAASFVGDIYSGLQSGSWTKADWQFAGDSLRILSGLYGVLRPTDMIAPYRLEMGYVLPGLGNMYQFWSDKLAQAMPETRVVIDVSAAEYTKAVLPYLKMARVIQPQFLTVSPKTGQPSQVIVHTKIARGAMANWLVSQRITNPQILPDFTDLGYTYAPQLSAEDKPVFICQQFEGVGLSVRLKNNL